MRRASGSWPRLAARAAALIATLALLAAACGQVSDPAAIRDPGDEQGAAPGAGVGDGSNGPATPDEGAPRSAGPGGDDHADGDPNKADPDGGSSGPGEAGAAASKDPQPLTDPDPDEPPVTEVAAGLRRFTGALFAVAGGDPGENVVFSPLSIGVAFGMARAGAGGQTAAEIDEVFAFPDAVHAAFAELREEIVTGENPPEPVDPDEEREAGEEPRPAVVRVANAQFVDAAISLRPAYEDLLADRYRSAAHPIDFADTAAAKRRMDDWAAEQTAERIEELFAEVDPAWLLVLANAVYLRADWEYPFAGSGPTEDEPFTRADGTEVEVAMMQQRERLAFAEGQDWRAVRLPYADTELAMLVLVPDAPDGAVELLDPTVVETARDRLEEGMVGLALPRWDFDFTVELVPPLQRLGITTAFSPAADFSGITADSQLFIDEGIHRATITVDEWGTEAAAVTGLGFADSGPPEPDVTIRADRPFAFVIEHTPTGAPLFAGHVADPSAGG